jgi:hypothetical protein
MFFKEKQTSSEFSRLRIRCGNLNNKGIKIVFVDILILFFDLAKG